MRLRLVLAVVAVCNGAPAALAHHSRYTADLNGAAVSPENDSPAVGRIVITIDFDLVTMQIASEFSSLTGTATQAHIHAPMGEVFAGTAGIATQVPSLDGFPNSGTSGNYSRTFDMNHASAYNPAFFAASGTFPSDSFNVLIEALDEGRAYFDIHSAAFPEGEIRGFLVHVPGDYNDNGVVDAADFALWRRTLGQTGEGMAADSNNDNLIGEEDFTTWRENFGLTRHDQHEHHHDDGAAAISSSVPEPHAAILLIALPIMWLSQRR